MKTFRHFNEEADCHRQQLNELLPLAAAIPAALKLGSAALTAYSAGSAINNARKGNWKKAGLDTLGAIPGGKVFKGIRALGGAKKLAKVGSFTQSAVRHGTDNAFNRAYGKVFDAGANLATAPFRGNAAKANTNTNTNNRSNQTTQQQTRKPKPRPRPTVGSHATTSTGKLRLTSGGISS